MVAMSHKQRERQRRHRIREHQALNIPRWVQVEYKPHLTQSTRTFRQKPGGVKMRRVPLATVVPNIEAIIVKTAVRAAWHDLDIFAHEDVLFRVKPWRRPKEGIIKLGCAFSDRIVDIYIRSGMGENDLVHTIAHELRHQGQFARGEFTPEEVSYEHDPIEKDADGFAELVLKEVRGLFTQSTVLGTSDEYSAGGAWNLQTGGSCTYRDLIDSFAQELRYTGQKRRGELGPRKSLLERRRFAAEIVQEMERRGAHPRARAYTPSDDTDTTQAQEDAGGALSAARPQAFV